MHFIAKTENTTAQYTRYIVSTITQKLFELSLIKVYEYLYDIYKIYIKTIYIVHKTINIVHKTK